MASARWLWLLHALLEGGGRVSARRPRYLFFASPKKSTQKKGDPAARVPLACGEGAACDARSWGVPQNSLRSSNSAQTAAASMTTRRVSFGTRSPQALRFSARSEGGGYRHGPLLRSACGPSLRSARQGDCASCVGSAQRVTDTRRSCESSSRVVPAPPPFWLRREAQELGWVRVPKDTRTSSSSLPQLFERSSQNAASSAAPPQIRASQVAPIALRAMGDADSGVAFSLVTFFWRSKRKLLRRRAHIPAPAHRKGTEQPLAEPSSKPSRGN
ncbi:hypothetical protein HNP48_004610 [Acidovorax soli]|uniref:Uncharacterized protein n=1 Tax=Acidovorax soli TaxID=592050 RepID=A0A7X0PHA7_9BURK|nr:hypothetical protein [Acidovorax soli]